MRDITLESVAEDNGDTCPERLVACRAMASIGAPPEALAMARNVDVVSSGLSALEWSAIILRAAQGHSPGAWAWSALTR